MTKAKAKKKTKPKTKPKAAPKKAPAPQASAPVSPLAPASTHPADALIDGQPLPQSHGRLNSGVLPTPPPKTWTR